MPHRIGRDQQILRLLCRSKIWRQVKKIWTAVSNLDDFVVSSHKACQLKSARTRECAQVNLEEDRQVVRIRECA